MLWTLYACKVAPPARFVMMTAKMLGVHMNVETVDLFAGDQRSEGFGKITPLRKVPVLRIHSEGAPDIHVTESTAIAIYMCDKNKPNSLDLYPEAPLARALVNEILFFHSGTLLPKDSDIMTDYFAGCQPIDTRKLADYFNALDFLEYKLNNKHWLADDQPTLADLACVATVTSMNLLAPFDEKRYGNIASWLDRMTELPCYKLNQDGLKELEAKIVEYEC